MPLKVFKMSVIEGQELVVPAEEGEVDELFGLDGSPRAATWSRPQVRLMLEREDGSPRSPSDFPFLGDHALVLKERTYSRLQPHLAAVGELLPLTEDATPLWLFNSCVVIPALDMKRSKVQVARSGRILRISEYVFRPDLLEGTLLFKTPETATLFMTEDFVSLVDSLGLEGLGRDQVWSV
jgi:hypothetical protein